MSDAVKVNKTNKKAATTLLIVGFENSGKSTLGATIKDALVINCDHKTYNFNQLHSNYTDWKGFDDFRVFVNEKIKKYKEKNQSLPKVVVFDTITHLYNTMIKYNSVKYASNKFAAMEKNNEDVIDIAEYVRFLNNKAGINVIIMAHAKVDPKNDRFTVPAQGSFRDSGSWQSFVSESIFINRDADTHTVTLKNPANACVRTNIKRIIDSEENIIQIPFNEFDVNAHLDEIVANIAETKDKEL